MIYCHAIYEKHPGFTKMKVLFLEGTGSFVLQEP